MHFHYRGQSQGNFFPFQISGNIPPDITIYPFALTVLSFLILKIQVYP